MSTGPVRRSMQMPLPVLWEMPSRDITGNISDQTSELTWQCTLPMVQTPPMLH
jgi:hypothetical protein